MASIIKRSIFLFVFLSLSNVYSQGSENIDLEFKDKSLSEIFPLIEAETDYRFFYEAAWLGSELYSGDFRNESIEAVLDLLLKETTLNYFIDRQKIILTNNTRIIASLPENFFGDSLETIEKDPIQETPMFKEKYAGQLKTGPSERELVSIGREGTSGNNSVFTITGRVQNIQTSKPIEDVAVYTADRSHGATTNEAGYYELRLPKGFYQIEISSLGYNTISQPILVYGDGKLDLDLQENMEMLGAVLIEDDRDENVERAIMGVSSLDPEKIKTIPLVLGERNILKVATTLPGIKTAGEGAMGFNVRGGRADQNLILLDDAVLYSPSHFLGFFSAINPFTTGGVDIYKGDIPAEFGGRLASVFDITTKDGNVEEFAGEASIGPVTGNLSLEIPIVKGKSSLVLGARAAYSDWILRSLSEEQLKNSQASFYDGILKYKHKLSEKDNVQATLYYSDDKFSITNDSLFQYKNKLGSLQWQHRFNDSHTSELSLVHSNYQYNIEYDSDNTRNFDFDYKIRESQAKLKFNYNPLNLQKHKFVYGISSKLYQVAPGNIRKFDDTSLIEPLSIPEEKGLESAVFISDNYEVTDRLLMNLGLRFSVYSALGPSVQNRYQPGVIKSGSSVVERLEFGKNEAFKTYGGPEIRTSLRYLLWPSISIKGSYNNTIQYIHLLSNNTTVSPTDTYKLSDYNTGPQRANQFALGMYKNFNEQDLELSVETYYKTMDNLLDYKVGADLILNENIESELLQGEGKAYGVEFLLKKETGNLNGYLGYSYSRTFVKLDSPILQERVNKGNYFPANHDRPHDFSFVGNYRITKRYSVSANFTYQTGRPVTYPVGRFNYAGEEQVLYSDRNKYRIPDYYRLDLGINIEGNHKKEKLAHSFWNISVYNVLGRNNPYSVYFVNDDGEIRSYKTSIFSIPIPTITYNFKF